jgi:hypothetical protein
MNNKVSSNQISNTSKGPKLIHGRGLNNSTEDEDEDEESIIKPVTDKKYKSYRLYYNKIYIDLNKLKENILFCKYISNNTNIPKLKTQHISNDLKDLIDDVLNDRYNKKLYETLTDSDKTIFKMFNKMFKFKLDVPDATEETEFREKFKILVGSYYSGNNSEELKTELKKYVRLGVSQGLISQRDGFSLMFELN